MLHKIPVFTHTLCHSLAILCLCGFLCGATRLPLETALVGDKGGAGKWPICLSVADTADSAAAAPTFTLTLNGEIPPDAEPDAPAAACITVDAADGWRILSIGQGRGENECLPVTSLTLTADIRGARAVILADGVLEDLAGLTILLTLEPTGKPLDGPIAAACPEGVAYYDSMRGGVDCIPVAEARAALGTADGAGEGTDTAADEAATNEGTDEPTDTAEPSGSEQEPRASARLIGCQETPCTSGIFSVRFIYEIDRGGAGQGSPPAAGVVCLVGGGVISVEVISADSVTAWVDGEATITPAAEAYFLLVAFRGLSARDEWVFAAERGDGTRALARWQDGRFMGWTVG